jgi:4a-hydroxytetrahydrobiopterin dehydratase
MSDTTNSVISPLIHRHCNPKVSAATSAEIQQWTGQIPAWKMQTGVLTRQFDFKNYYQTIAFVNAIAWIAHGQDHHPDLLVSYNKCIVSFSTHSVGGLSENDFISAAKVDALFSQPA